ncbi:uncharacterized protein LOC115407563 [Salarias fasciatus]|uniref:uncharacterized protein LOC115407563 n=1 Tax=Salarias fasciatus TaxID=181472 RepID=UPI0011767313|nr:uncharacterized protein LOC115407563 [Salarias fasciatus]
MDSSPVLRQQSQNKIQRDLQRMKNDQNKKPASQKSAKLLSSPRHSQKDGENKNPGDSKPNQKVPVRPGGSRLPVLAKSLRLQTPSNFSQVHCAWEEKPLAGKTKTKKPCTRPVPFNFSKHRGSRAATEGRLNDLKSHTVDQTTTNTSKTKPAQSKGADATHHLSGRSGSCSTLKACDPKPIVHHKGASATSAEVCVSDFNQLSLHNPSKNSQPAQPDPLEEKANYFRCDHKALLSILQNEGVSVSGQTSATPQSKPFHSLPQRVSIMKSHHKAGTTRGPPKSVQFSPDPAALQSILLNEGVKAGGPAGMTPRNSTCLPGRGTSICTPQRVPVKKTPAESMGGLAAGAVKETPQNPWHPQRVPNSRQHPLSALKFHLMGPKSPYYTPGSRRCKSKLQPQEEVIQRLFDDREDEQSDEATHKDPAQASESDVPCEEKGETVTTSSGVEPPSSQVFIQAPGRESVIFFSSGTKLYRVPPVEDQVNPPERPRTELPGQKTCSLAPPAEMLRRRFPLLEEARMDHEVSTYTSQPVPACSRFLPPRPRCGNPLASAFLFEESTRFLPIDCPVSTTHCAS